MLAGLDAFNNQVYDALKAAFSELLHANPDQDFYAFALWTDDSLQFLHAVANTEEGLDSTVKHYKETIDPKYNTTSTHANLRWSYGDWLHFPEVGAEHFEKINEVLHANFHQEEGAFNELTESLWPYLLQAFQRLESEHFFGTGHDRSKITLLLVGDLPTELVESWVTALNPADVAARFIHWEDDISDEVIRSR